MKVKITYPQTKCAYCGTLFTKKHGNQKYCSNHCRKEAEKEQNRNRQLRYYHRHKNRINTTRIGTRTIGPKPNPDPEREAEIVENEITRIGLTQNFIR